MCDFDACLAEVDLLRGIPMSNMAPMDLRAVGRRKRQRRGLQLTTDGGGRESPAGHAWTLTGRFACQYTPHVMQKRKRYQEGFIGLHDAGVSLYSFEADEALDSVIWTYTLRRDWNEARNRSATLEMLLQRHIARIQFGSGEGGLVQGSGCVAAGHGGATEGRFSVNVGVVSGDMFRSAGAIEGHAFGGICRPSIGPVEDNEFEAILKTAKTKANSEVEDEEAALLLQPSKAPRRAPLPIMGSIEEVRRDSAMPAFPPYCPPRTPFDLLDLEFAVPSEGGDNSTQLSSTHVAMSMHSYTLLHLDTLYRSLYFGLRDLATGSRLARSAQFKRCPLGPTCKLKMTDKGEARLYFPAHSQANSKRKRGGSKLFFKASSMSGKEMRMETPDIFLFSVKGTWVVYASAWRGLNPQGLLRVEPLTEATRRLQDGLVVGSTTACDRLHCLEGVGQRLQYIETLRTLLSTKCEEGSDHEGDAFNASSGSRASLDPGAICCTSLCLFGGLVSGHRLLNRSLTLPTAVDLDACMEATMELFPNLNSDQIAVLKHVQAWFTDNTAEPLIMVQGVYGSGKTTVLAAVISLLCEVLVASCGPVIPIAHRRVGLLSLTNVAVDNVLLKLKSKGFEDFVRLGVYDRIAADLRDDFFARTQSRSRMEGPPGLSALDWKARAVVAATLASAIDLTVPCPFVVVDECGQVTEPTLMLPFMRSLQPIRILMFGDPKQLPPPPDDCPIKSPSGSTSVMTLITRRHESHHGRRLLRRLQLRTQYRCHPDISAICSTLFYDGQVVTQYTSPIRGPILPSMAPIIVLQHSSCSPPQRRGDSLYHRGEADLVVRLVERLSRRIKDICVICMYKAMVQEMKDRIMDPITVATVDSFQGSEASVVIVVLTYQRSSSGHFGTFISDPQRANVAVSRAKDHLVVVGHESAFHHSSSTRVWSFVRDRAQVVFSPEDIKI